MRESPSSSVRLYGCRSQSRHGLQQAMIERGNPEPQLYGARRKGAVNSGGAAMTQSKGRGKGVKSLPCMLCKLVRAA